MRDLQFKKFNLKGIPGEICVYVLSAYVSINHYLFTKS